MLLRVKLKGGANFPAKFTQGDWIDLSAYGKRTLVKGEYAKIDLGVAIQLPKGYEAIIAPRSSTFERYKVIEANSIGIIDESYCGDNDYWSFPIIAFENTVIPHGARICQFRILEHQPKIFIDFVDVLGNKNRGGFGSTGV